MLIPSRVPGLHYDVTKTSFRHLGNEPVSLRQRLSQRKLLNSSDTFAQIRPYFRTLGFFECGKLSELGVARNITPDRFSQAHLGLYYCDAI